MTGLVLDALRDHPNSHYVNDHDIAAALVEAQAQSHDLVIASFHGGAEGSSKIHLPDKMEYLGSEKRGHLRKFARVVVDAGAEPTPTTASRGGAPRAARWSPATTASCSRG